VKFVSDSSKFLARHVERALDSMLSKISHSTYTTFLLTAY
jgi:hypothetical protein